MSISESQARASEFIRHHGLSTSAAARYIDLISETGELGKELLISGDYGKREISATPDMTSEIGDVIFSLLALCGELGVDAGDALERAISKYRGRHSKTGQIGSGARSEALD